MCLKPKEVDVTDVQAIMADGDKFAESALCSLRTKMLEATGLSGCIFLSPELSCLRDVQRLSLDVRVRIRSRVTK